jgi:hypothetical protein
VVLFLLAGLLFLLDALGRGSCGSTTWSLRPVIVGLGVLASAWPMRRRRS